MKNVHIPEVMETNQFESFKLFKVMGTEDPEANSYSVQYFAAGMKNIQMYMAAFAPELQQKAVLKWPGMAAAYRTLLESV